MYSKDHGTRAQRKELVMYVILEMNSTEDLRAAKLRLADAKGGSADHKLFCAVDRVLVGREILVHLPWYAKP